jgi:LCP family protein required for cell wall assembly
MIVLSVDPYEKSASMLSIPRDLWVTIPIANRAPIADRINAAMVYGETMGHPGGGAALARETVPSDLGVPLHYTVVVDFAGFQRIIDTLGGVDVYLSEALVDPEFPTADGGTVSIFIPAGQQRLNGEKALWYARSRYQRADYGRMHHQQQLLLAMREKALRLDLIPRLPELVRELGNTVTTDIPLEAALNLGRLLNAIPPDRITAKAVEGDLVRSATTSGGAAVLILNQAKMAEVVRELFYDARLRGEAASVIVTNGTQRNGLATRPPRTSRPTASSR